MLDCDGQTGLKAIIAMNTCGSARRGWLVSWVDPEPPDDIFKRIGNLLLGKLPFIFIWCRPGDRPQGPARLRQM